MGEYPWDGQRLSIRRASSCGCHARLGTLEQVTQDPLRWRVWFSCGSSSAVFFRLRRTTGWGFPGSAVSREIWRGSGGPGVHVDAWRQIVQAEVVQLQQQAVDSAQLGFGQVVGVEQFVEPLPP